MKCYEEALVFCKETMKRNTTNAKILIKLSDILIKLNKSYDESLNYLIQAHKTMPNKVKAIVALGDFYIKHEKVTEALNLYNKALETKPNNMELLWKRAQLYGMRTLYSKSVDL